MVHKIKAIPMNFTKKQVQDAFLGLAVADALGVPVEFLSREELQRKPVSGMLSFGTHNQPAGTWSDDSSMTFCLAESLCKGYQIDDIAKKFIDWKKNAYWTAHNHVFDIGNQTHQAINRLEKFVQNQEKIVPMPNEEATENQNGNGSLMRILPLAFYTAHHSPEEQFFIVNQVSSLTHPHIRSVIACFIYVRLAVRLLLGQDKFAAYEGMQAMVRRFLQHQQIDPKEIAVFDRILNSNIAELPSHRIASSGYVVHTLEAALWCLLRHENYAETVLKAVNFGEDTDTTAAVVGGLAGIVYGSQQIPKIWLEVLVKKEEILGLSQHFHESLFVKSL